MYQYILKIFNKTEFNIIICINLLYSNIYIVKFVLN